jgi:hypothetical protein
MPQAAEILRRPMAAAFEAFAGPVQYRRAAAQIAIQAAVRDFRGADLFGSAAVGDRLVVVRAPDFLAASLGNPQRYDSIILADGEFTVIDWRAAPPVDTPVWFRLAVRGGTR